MKKAFPPGFTLIEILLALGVFSFCLVGLLGLCSVGLRNSASAGEDTTLAAMSLAASANLRGLTNATPGLSTNFYFDQAGAATNDAAAFFKCQAVLRHPASSELSDTNLMLAKLQFTWPAKAIIPPHTNTIYATLAP